MVPYHSLLIVSCVKQQRVRLFIAAVICVLSLLMDTVVPCHQQPRVPWLYWSHLLSSCCAQACFSGVQSTRGWDRHGVFSQALRLVLWPSKATITPSQSEPPRRFIIRLQYNPLETRCYCRITYKCCSWEGAWCCIAPVSSPHLPSEHCICPFPPIT